MKSFGLILCALTVGTALFSACGSNVDNGTSAAGTGSGAGVATGTGAGGGASGCHDGTDCPSGPYFCVAYTLEPLCHGKADTTFSFDCQADADCADAGAGFICDNTLCVFPHGGAQTPPHCRPGCTTDADCGPGHACTPSQRCEIAACGAQGACGLNYTCVSGACAPTPCHTDAECTGFCVVGACSATTGDCEEAVP